MRKSPGNDETNFSSFQPIVVVVITTVIRSNIPINIILINIIVMGGGGEGVGIFSFFSLFKAVASREF